MPRTKQFTKEEVLNKAVDLFWEQGFHATSMDSLVKNLGINRASMYNEFGSKQALFYEALQTYKQQNAERIEAFFYQQVNIRYGFWAYFEMLIQPPAANAIQKGCFVVNTTTELANNSESVRQELLENKARFEGIFLAFLQRGVDQGQISPFKNLKQIAAYFYTFQSGLQVVAKLGNSHEEMMESVQSVLKVLD